MKTLTELIASDEACFKEASQELDIRSTADWLGVILCESLEKELDVEVTSSEAEGILESTRLLLESLQSDIEREKRDIDKNAREFAREIAEARKE